MKSRLMMWVMVLMIMFVPSVIYASEVTTTFVDGKTFNEKIKRLVAVEEGISDTSLISYDSEDIYITEFKRYEGTPSDAYLIDDNVVSTSDSVEKIYVWYDNNILYWYSKAEEVYLNSDATHMFHKLTKITTLNVSDFNTSNVKSMGSMFAYCSSLTTLDVSNFETDNVTDMGFMFLGCSKLINLDLSSFNTDNVTIMWGMFWKCNNLEKLSLSNFNTSNVTNMGAMFADCNNLKEIDLSSFDTSKVTDMGGMFENCESLTSLDLSSFDTSNVTNMLCMFYGDSLLEKIYVSYLWNTDGISVSDEIFNDNYVLSGNNGTKYDANYRNKDYAVIDRVGKNGYLSVKMNISSDVYDLDNDYIYVGNDEFDISNIVISGAIEKEYINNKLYIEYNDLVIKQYDITSMSSDTYNLDNDYIIVKGSINTSLIDIVNGSIEVDDDNNELIIKYGNIVLDKYDILYPLESISLNKSFMKLKIGTMSSLSVIYNPFNTTDSKDVIWTSSDESILTVDSEGNIEAVGIGSATITVTSVLDSRLTASCEVMVVDYLSGDMNNNGKIEFADVMILLRSYLGITEETDDSVKFGDMNGNGKIDFADVMILLRSYLDID